MCLCVQMKPSECLNLDAVLEMALIKCTVKPLKEHVYRLFEYDYTRYAVSTRVLNVNINLLVPHLRFDAGVRNRCRRIQMMQFLDAE